MGIATVTPPATDPITIAEAKTHLRVTESVDDGLIAGLILAARQFAEDYTRRRIITQTLDYTINSDWPWVRNSDYCGNRIDLPALPLQSVTSISYVDTAGASQTLASSQYVVKSDEEISHIIPAYDATWPDVRCQPNAITVRFVAGWDFSAVPNPIREAIKMHVEILYDRSPDMRELLEKTRDSLLDPYRILRIL